MLKNIKKLERIVREYREFDEGQQMDIQSAERDNCPNTDSLRKMYQDWKMHEYDRLLVEIEKVNRKITEICEIYELR